MASGFPESVPAWYTGPMRSEHVHDVGPPAEGTDREPAADHLAEARQVGRDAVVLLRAAEPPAGSR